MRSAAKRQKVANRNRRVAELTSQIGEWQPSGLSDRAALLNASFEPIFIWAFPSRQIQSWNIAAEELYGYSRAEAEGRSADELLRTTFTVPVKQIEQELKETHHWSGEITRTSRDGRQIEIECLLMLVAPDEETIVVEANRDLTEHKRAEERRNQLAAIIDNVPQGILVLNTEGGVIAANRAFARLAEFRNVEEIPTSVDAVSQLFELHDSEGQLISEVEQPTHMALRGRVVRDREFAITNRSSGKQWFGTVSAIPIRNESGAVAQVVLSIHDLSERKKMENALRQANADLEQFAYAAAHDLQEPARSVGLYSQVLAQQYGDSLGDEKTQLVSAITQGARRMQDLIRDLLAYTRAIESHADDEIGTDAKKAFEEVVQNLTASVTKTRAQINCGALPRVAVPKAHIIQIFQNMLTNALKYGGNPPVVNVWAEPIGPHFRFTVQDNGSGIPREYHERIFKVFTRLHGKDVPGTGIGLAICERIVNHYGGRIWVKSAVGQGTSFQFILPGLDKEPCQKKSAS